MSDIETEKMNGDHKEDETGHSDRRRRLLKGVAVSAPVILTVANKPAWGGYNCTLSGQLSGNLSHPDIDEECGGEGCTPGYWKNHKSSWLDVDPYTPENLYEEAFISDDYGVVTVFSSVLGNMTLGMVIQLCDYEYNPDLTTPSCGDSRNCANLTRQLGFHSVAALQNAGTSLSYALTVKEVIDMTAHAFNFGDKSDIETVKNLLDDYNNNSLCPYGGNPACGQGGGGKNKKK